jgi:hypothetical protein
MANQQTDSAQMTIESCITLCENLGYVVAGTEYTTQCFCDNVLRNGVTLAPESDCNMPCGGNSAEVCGAGDRLTVWSKGNLTVVPIPVIEKTDLPQNWSYVGCLLDGVTSNRPLPYKLVHSNNSVGNCIEQCQKYGFPAAGVEYGEECYCGDYSDVVATGPTIQLDTDCSMPCAGNASALCGSGGRLQTYFWNSTTALNGWKYPAEVDAGAYKYFMGGVVVPLMTTYNVNGKVTFLEKFGTGKRTI